MNNENLKPFKPGVSGNPAGRPKKEYCLTDILKEQGNIKDEIDTMGNLITRKQAVARKLWAMATAGDVVALKYLYDRLDGKPLQTIEANVNRPDIDMSNLTLKEKKALANINRKRKS